jgi:hypothetical protein
MWKFFFMSISASDNKWERRLLAAFESRVSFELSDVDLLGDDPFKSIARWCACWNYSPTFVGLRNIRFSPE